MSIEDQLRDFRFFAERFFSIRDRKARVLPFKFNALQETLHSEITGSDDVLKARKGGVSTYIILRALHKCLMWPNRRALILAHEHRSAIDLFEIVKTAVDLGIPCPAMSTALVYYDSYRSARLPANLLQAQRDYFGAHTYERTDKPRGTFFHTNWTGRGGTTYASEYIA